MIAQPYNRFVFVSWSWRLPCNGNQALESMAVSLIKENPANKPENYLWEYNCAI